MEVCGAVGSAVGGGAAAAAAHLQATANPQLVDRAVEAHVDRGRVYCASCPHRDEEVIVHVEAEADRNGRDAEKLAGRAAAVIRKELEGDLPLRAGAARLLIVESDEVVRMLPGLIEAT